MNSIKKRKLTQDFPKFIAEKEKLQLQTESRGWLNDKEEKILSKKISDILIKFTEKIAEFSFIQADHFESIRREIDIKRECLIQEIYLNEKIDINRLNLIQNMIKEIEQLEKEFRSNFDNNIKPSLIGTHLDKNSNFFANFKTQLNLFDSRLLELKSNYKNFKLFEYDLRRNKIVNENETSLGRLILFKNFFSTTNEPILNILITNYEYEPWRNRISIFNLNTNSILKSLIIEKVIEYHVFDDSTKVASFGDSLIQIWDLAEATTTNQSCLQKFHHENVTCIKMLSLTRLASGSDNGSIKIWNVESGECMHVLLGHTMRILSLESINGDANSLISLSWDETMRFWDLNNETCIKCIKGCDFKLIKSLKNKLFASVDNSSYYGDKTIKIWNFINGKCEQMLKGHSRFINNLEFYSSKNQLISCSDDKTIRIWDMNMYRCVNVVDSHQKCFDSIKLVPYSHDSFASQMLLAFVGKLVFLLDLNTCEWMKSFQLESNYNQVHVCKNSQRFLDI